MSTPRILVADGVTAGAAAGATPWHQALLTALGEDAAQVELTDDGQRLLGALAEPSRDPRRVILVGEGLRTLGGLDALYKTATVRGGAPEPAPGAPAVLLILDVRHDMELLELLRARGVHGFVRRTDPIEDTASKIRSCLYVEQRVARRWPVKARAQLEVEGKTVAAMLEDLSSGGAMIVAPAKRLQPPPPIGASLVLESTIFEQRLHMPCVLCRAHHRKALLGDRLELGVSFAALDADRQAALAAVIDRLRAASQVADAPWVDTDSLSGWGG